MATSGQIREEVKGGRDIVMGQSRSPMTLIDFNKTTNNR